MSEITSESSIYIQDYTSKSFVVRGDTKPYREALKSMGGKWNPSLTDRETGDKFGAWIFWGEKKKEIEKWIVTAAPQSPHSPHSEGLNIENKNYDSPRRIAAPAQKTSLEEKIDRLLVMMTSICKFHDIKLEDLEASEI